jgi:predicted membrane channel-forming protein YqfA (hemolysin III family)
MLKGLRSLGKKGQEASAWSHLGGWIIALVVLVILVVIALNAFGVIDLDFIRNARFG